MKFFCFHAASLLFFAAALAVPAQSHEPMGAATHKTGGQDGASKPLASPAATAETTLAGKAITIRYNSPAMRGRKIMGELVPFGKVWRTGANSATSLVTAGNLRIGNLSVPAGSYTLYTIPADPVSPWILIVNKQTGQSGTVYNQPQDLGHTVMKGGKLAAPQESMSISFERTKKNSTELHVRWETTDEWVKIEALK